MARPNAGGRADELAAGDLVAPGRPQRADQRAEAEDREQDRERARRCRRACPVTRSGIVTEKLKANVPTIAIITSGTNSWRSAADVAQPGADLALGLGHRRRAEQLARAHGQQAGDDGGVAEGVEDERPAEADGDDEDAGQRRADHPGAGHHGAVQADGVGDLAGRHHLDDERAPARVVERRDDALHGGEGVDRRRRWRGRRRRRRRGPATAPSPRPGAWSAGGACRPGRRRRRPTARAAARAGTGRR